MESKFGAVQVDVAITSALTGWSVDQLIKWRDEESSTCVKVVKQVVVVPAFMALTIIGIIETVARAILSVLVKPLDLVVPRQCCISEISHYLISTITIAALGAAIAAFEILGNWLPLETENGCGRAITKANLNLFSNFFYPIDEYRLCNN